MRNTIFTLLAILCWIVVPLDLEAQSQTATPHPAEYHEHLTIGPIPGLTSAWHKAPRATAVPIDTPIRFRVRAPGDAQVLWTGAREVHRNSGWSTAEATPDRVGDHAVEVSVIGPDDEASLLATTTLTVLDIEVDAISVSDVRITTGAMLPEAIDSNASTMDYYFRGASIAEVNEAAPGVYRTSINRWLRLAVDVEPAGFAPLIEWRLDGQAQTHLGSTIRMRVFAARPHEITAGPGDASRARLETWMTQIVSHRDGAPIDEWQPVTFRAITEPPGYEDQITWLASTKSGSCDPLRGRGPEFTVSFRDTFGSGGRWLGVRADNARFADDAKAPGTPGRQDEVSVRTEENLGRPSRMVEDPDEGPWLTTEANRFVTIQKQAYFRGDNETVHGIRMASSFVAETPTTVAISFAAEAYVAEIPSPVGLTAAGKGADPTAPVVDGDSRMFVRALVDGEPVDPADVVFTVGAVPGARSFVFTARVDSGIHTVEMQWLVDPPGPGTSRVVGHLRDASLLVRQARQDGADGSLVVRTAPSGPSVVHDAATWVPIPDMAAQVEVSGSGVLVATLAAEAAADDTTRFALRALVDGVPALPHDIIFADGAKVRSRSASFVADGLAPGLHTVRFEWLADGPGEILAGDRSMSLAAFPSSASFPTHPAVVLDGAQDTTESALIETIPGMETTIWIPERGNGEVAVLFSSEAHVTEGGTLDIGLQIDGVSVDGSVVSLTCDGEEADTRSWVFDAKKLSPGLHRVNLDWRVTSLSGGGTPRATLGDRTMAVIAEVGAIPDLAEQGGLGVGLDIRQDDRGPDHITGLEPAIGTRDVLVILWDADRPGQPDQSSSGYDPGALEDAFFDAADSAAAYFELASGDRFGLSNAGVLGWFDAARDEATNYWNHPGTCTSDGYVRGEVQRRSEAVKAAAATGYPFADHDLDNDGRISARELAIVVVYPQAGYFGQARQPVFESEAACSGSGSNEPLVADGVVIEEAVDCFGCDASRGMVLAHELGHQLLGLDDLYSSSGNPATRAAWKALMALPSPSNTTVLNPAYRLALGWATPRIIEEPGIFTALDTKLSDQVFVLPRYDHAESDEYFLVENRQTDVPTGWDRQLGGPGVGESGLAVWHVVHEAADRIIPPIGVGATRWTQQVTATPGRHGIRLLRPWTQIDGSTGDATFDPTRALWSSNRYDLLSAPCPGFLPPGPQMLLNTLTWADCTASGYDLRFLSPPPIDPDAADPLSTTMRFQVAIDP